MKSVAKAVIILSIFAFLSRLFGFIYRIYLSHMAGETGMGIYQMALSLLAVFITFFTSGLPSTIQKQTSIYENTKQYHKQHSLITKSLIISIAISIILSLIVILGKDILVMLGIEKVAINILLFMLPALFFGGIQNVFRGFLWGKKEFLSLSIIELIEQATRVLFIFLICAITNRDAVICGAIALSLSYVISFMLSLISYIKYKGKLTFKNLDFKELKPAISITGVKLIGSLIQPIIAIVIPAQLILAGYTNSQALSLYGACIGMVIPLLLLPATFIGSLAMAIMPDLSYHYSENNTQILCKQITSALLFTTIISLMFVPIFSSFGSVIGKILFNSDISGYILEYSSWIMLPLGFSSLTSSILNSIGLENKGFWNYIISSVFLIISAIILPRFVGINSYIIGLGLSCAVNALLNLVVLARKINFKASIIKPVLIISLSIIPISAINKHLFGIIGYIFPDLINLIICCGVSIVCYLLLCCVFNIIDIVAVKSILKTKVLHKNFKQ